MNYTKTINALAAIVADVRPDWPVPMLADKIRELHTTHHLTAGQALDAALRAAGEPTAIPAHILDPKARMSLAEADARDLAVLGA